MANEERIITLAGVDYRCSKPEDAAAVRITRSIRGEADPTATVEFSLCGPDGRDRVRVDRRHYTRKGGEWRVGREGVLRSERELGDDEILTYYADMGLIEAANTYLRMLNRERAEAQELRSRPRPDYYRQRLLSSDPQMRAGLAGM